MELLNKYNGAVFFVDILGMGALTNNQIELKTEDYSPWLDQHQIEHNHQYLAAAVLAQFRGLLTDLDEKFANITVSQLSDCAFIWSERISDVVLFASQFMTNAIKAGLLCRGGLTYGEIIETNQNHKLGRFIVGKAVTKAVNLEKIAKGARILIDEDFPMRLADEHDNFFLRIAPLFKEFINPLDFSIYDEFKWYLCAGLTYDQEDLRNLSYKKRVSLTKERLKLASQIRWATKFSWNARSKEGLVQLRATMNFMTESKLLDVCHNLDWNVVDEDRREGKVKSMEQVINDDENYAEPKNEHLLNEY